ncbi:MAG: chorismate mutase [Longimicrobiales bacterium]
MNPAHPDEAERLQRLAFLRDQVFDCDQELVRVVGLRRSLIREIEEIKRDLGLPLVDPDRDGAVVLRAAELADSQSVDPVLISDLMWRIMAAASQQQVAGPEVVAATDEAFEA